MSTLFQGNNAAIRIQTSFLISKKTNFKLEYLADFKVISNIMKIVKRAES